MGSRFVCSSCFTAFTTSSHLHRHERSHYPRRPFPCFFCKLQFSRPDTARRHAKTCQNRNGRPMPQYRKRGKGRTSCDQCARAKLSCDVEVPCGSCKNNRLRCTYVRLQSSSQFSETQTSRPSRPEQGYIEESPISTRVPTSAAEGSSSCPKIKIPFLLSYYDVNSTAVELHRALESGRPGPDQCRDLLTYLDPFMMPPLEDMLNVMFSDDLLDSHFLRSQEIEAPYVQSPLNIPSENTAHRLSDVLRDRAKDIVKELALAAERLKTSVPNIQAGLDAAVSHQLFSASNIVEFVRLYFYTYHRHCPILHLASFHIEATSLPLLLAIVLCGSVSSYPRDTYGLAVDCLDLAEEYIFDLPIFKIGAPLQRLPALTEPLKAAVIVICLQYGRNNAEVRRRVRSLRFPALVYAARSLSLFALPPQEPRFESLTFSQKESLVRTATYIFLLDCQYVACFRSPPLITVAELTGNLPTSEAKFNEEDSLQTTIPPQSPTRSLSLAETMDLLMDDSWCGVENPLFQKNSIFGLFAVICALHSMMFSALATRTMRHQLPCFERALSRWDLLWDKLTQQISGKELGLVGFMMCARELLSLAKVVLQSDNREFLNGLDSDSKSQFYSLLKRVAGIQANSD